MVTLLALTILIGPDRSTTIRFALSISALHRVAAGLVVGSDDVLDVGVGTSDTTRWRRRPTEPQADTSPGLLYKWGSGGGIQIKRHTWEGKIISVG